MRDAAAVDDALRGRSVFAEAIEDHAGVESSAFDGGEQFVLRGVQQVPSDGHAAEIGIDQDRAVAVVPGHAQQAGLAGAIFV